MGDLAMATPQITQLEARITDSDRLTTTDAWPAHHLLGEDPAQAQPDQHHPPGGQRVEQGEHILHGILKVETPGRLAGMGGTEQHRIHARCRARRGQRLPARPSGCAAGGHLGKWAAQWLWPLNYAVRVADCVHRPYCCWPGR